MHVHIMVLKHLRFKFCHKSIHGVFSSNHSPQSTAGILLLGPIACIVQAETDIEFQGMYIVDVYMHNILTEREVELILKEHTYCALPHK